jgi:hypothetical protein
VSTGSELTKDHVGVDKSAGLHVLLGIAQGLMQRGAVFLVEPISRIERQEIDFRSFWKVRRLINDEPSGLYASLEGHIITVAPKAQPSNLAVACARSATAATLRLPELRRVAK